MANQQSLEIDLTGRDGLMDTFFGDYDINNTATPATNLLGQPQRRYGNASSGMMASGAFNPFKRNGYLSPSDISVTNIQQAGGAVSSLQVASCYDVANAKLYFLEQQVNSSNFRLLRGDGFEDNDLSVDHLYSSPGSFTGNDLEIYSINGERTLFASIGYGTGTRLHTRNLNYDNTTETFTVNTGTDVITLTKSNANYTIANDMVVYFTTSGTLPGGMSTNSYYVINATDSGTSATFKISNSLGGSAVDITSSGTGTQYLSPYRDAASTFFINSLEFSINGKVKMIKSGDGFMYILDGFKVHRFDGTVIGGSRGTLYQSILQAPSYYRFTGGIDHKNNMYIIMHQNPSLGIGANNGQKVTTECGVYIWNRQASFFNSSQYIPINGIREINRIWVNEADEILLMATDSENYGQLYKFNGTSFVKIKRLPQRGVVFYDDSLYVSSYGTTWLAADGLIYHWGVSPKGTKPGLFILGELNSSSSSMNLTPGVALHGSTTPTYPESTYFSYNDGGVKIGRFYPNFNGGTTGTDIYTHRGDISTPVVYLPKMSTLNHIDLFFSTTTTSGSTIVASIKFYKNQQSSPFMTKYITRDDLVKGYISIELNVPYSNSMQMRFNYFNLSSAPPTGGTQTSGTLDFAPSFAVLKYTPSQTIR